MKVLEHAETNTREAFAAMRKAAGAKNPAEVAKIQGEYLREQGARIDGACPRDRRTDHAVRPRRDGDGEEIERCPCSRVVLGSIALVLHRHGLAAVARRRAGRLRRARGGQKDFDFEIGTWTTSVACCATR